MEKIKFSIFISVFVSFLGLTVIMPILSPLIRELHLSESHAGWIVSIGSIAMTAAGPLWGVWSDKKGRKPIMLIGLLGLFVTYAMFTIVVYMGLNQLISGGLLLASLIGTRFLIGLFIPSVPPTAQAYMADVTQSQDRSSGMSLISAANGLGLVLGPALAGVLALAGLIWPLYLGTFLPLAAFTIVLAIIPKAKPLVRDKPAKVNPFQKDVRLYLLIGLTTMIGIITLQSITGFYLQDKLMISTDEMAKSLAIGFTLSGVAMVLTQVIQMKWLKWGPDIMIITGSFLVILSMLCLLVGHTLFICYLGFFLFGLGAGLMMPGFMTGASLAVSSKQQGAVAGLVAAVQGIAAIITSVLSTSLYEFNQSIPYILVTVIVSISLCLTIGIKHFSREKAPTSSRF
ncbi:MFS transporter [Bacillus sp. CLL-7-23]|uniref:MFS transporter n=1 Tax=Bacillus changyiensis TaxID=3004103 RepID=A0ABT4XAA2_9BACI|nr:MFS transporter [Bacillus changyiensis]MDA7028341.1 MFS transporter [Bacillus changyiensis]